jgi:hypothetical protein
MFYAVDIQMTDYTALPVSGATPMPPSLALLSGRNDKRERKQTAQSLPPGITHNMMKKFVVYYREIMYLKNGKQQIREYFKVESHPSLNKPWVSSKSMKIPLLEKLNDANQYVATLDTSVDAHAPVPEYGGDGAGSGGGGGGGSVTERWSKNLPKYTMLRMNRSSPSATTHTYTFIYDRKDNVNGFRWTCSHTFLCPTNSAAADARLSLGLQCLRDKLREKYGADLLTMTATPQL